MSDFQALDFFDTVFAQHLHNRGLFGIVKWCSEVLTNSTLHLRKILNIFFPFFGKVDVNPSERFCCWWLFILSILTRFWCLTLIYNGGIVVPRMMVTRFQKGLLPSPFLMLAAHHKSPPWICPQKSSCLQKQGNNTRNSYYYIWDNMDKRNIVRKVRLSPEEDTFFKEKAANYPTISGMIRDAVR